MKKLFLMLAAAAAVASCSKDYTIVADQGEAIEFGSFVENSTRANAATDPSYSTTAGKGVALTQFNVYGAVGRVDGVGGVNIFNGNLVTKGDNAYNAAWTLTGATQYWINGANYEFVAVVDGNKTGVTTTKTDTDSGIPTTIEYTSDGATDLLCARVLRTKDANGNTDTSVVPFTFTHLLSKVMFSVKNNTTAAATNYRIKLTSAKITGALASDSYIVANAAWDTTNAITTKEFTLENLTINSAATEYHPTELLLLPGVNVGVTVTADVEATDDDWQSYKVVSTISKTFENVLGVGNTLVANRAYHFAVTLGIGTEIEFTATQMPEWVDGDDADDTPLQ